MKRTTLFAIAAVFAATTTAIPLAAQDVSVGVKAGVSISNVSTDQVGFENTDSRTGLVGGAFLSLGLSDMLGLQVEGLYSQEGFGVSEGGASVTAELDYISIPVFLKVNLGPEDAQVRPNLFAGGFFAFEASCSVSGDIGGTEASGDCDTDLDERKTSNYGILFGGGVSIAVSDGLNVVLDGRYNLGLSNFDDSAEGEADPVRSRGFAFMGGIEIPLGN